MLVGFMIGFNILLSVVAYVMKRLTFKGAIAAAMVGSLIWIGGGFYAWGLLGVFFITSSFWSSYKDERKYHLYHLHEKGGQRDVIQVIANGGVAAFCCLSYLLFGQEYFLLGTTVSIAAATADTWASEIGVLSSKPPRSLLTMKPIQTGMSGGVSLLGTFSQIVGSSLIAILSLIGLKFFYQLPMEWMTVFLLISGMGVLGSIIDSLLGAYVQAKYECRICQLETERLYHHGVKTKLVKGIPFMTNDIVNLLSNVMVVMLSILCYQILQ